MAGEMIERVARAIYESRNGKVADEKWQETWLFFVDIDSPFIREARAAIEAMSEPTKEQMKAGYSAWRAYEWNFYSDHVGVEQLYRAMIDAATK